VAAVGALVALSGLRHQRDRVVAPGGELPVRSGDLARRSAVPVAVPVPGPSVSVPVPSAELATSGGELADYAAATEGAGTAPRREAVRDGTTA